MMKWGLIPFWAKDPSIDNRMINARAETLMEKSAFKNAFQRRRCLAIAVALIGVYLYADNPYPHSLVFSSANSKNDAEMKTRQCAQVVMP